MRALVTCESSESLLDPCTLERSMDGGAGVFVYVHKDHVTLVDQVDNIVIKVIRFYRAAEYIKHVL